MQVTFGFDTQTMSGMISSGVNYILSFQRYPENQDDSSGNQLGKIIAIATTALVMVGTWVYYQKLQKQNDNILINLEFAVKMRGTPSGLCPFTSRILTFDRSQSSLQMSKFDS